MNKEIFLLFFLVLYCSSSTDDSKLLRYFTFGSDNSFEFLEGYRTYYLEGSLQDYKEVEFIITSEKSLTQIKYLFTNREYFYPEDLGLHMFLDARPSERIVGANHEYSFTAETSKATRYLIIAININSPAEKYFNVSISSKYPTTSIFVKILIGIGLILLLACCIIICKLTGGSALEGVAACLAVVACCCRR
jgi:hypothetical protein